MLNLKNNENDRVFAEICKIKNKKRKLNTTKISKNEGCIFWTASPG